MSFYSKLVRLKDSIIYLMYKENQFLFQIGAIKRLSKNNIYSITKPYSCCQVKFYFVRFLEGLLSTSNRANSLGG